MKLKRKEWDRKDGLEEVVLKGVVLSSGVGWGGMEAAWGNRRLSLWSRRSHRWHSFPSPWKPPVFLLDLSLQIRLLNKPYFLLRWLYVEEPNSLVFLGEMHGSVIVVKILPSFACECFWFRSPLYTAKTIGCQSQFKLHLLLAMWLWEHDTTFLSTRFLICKVDLWWLV